MKDITDLRVAQIRIFAADKLPFQQLSAGRNAERIKEHFRFENLQTDATTGQHTFSKGVYSKDSHVVVVDDVSIDPRRIALRVLGTSEQGDSVYGEIWKLLNNLSSKHSPTEASPLVKSQETFCVATLDVGFEELVSPALVKLFETVGKQLLSTVAARAKSIDFHTLAFTVKYEPIDPTLEERGITLVGKTITIQPRMGTALRERRFFISSPTDSETHLALIAEVESSLLKARPS